MTRMSGAGDCIPRKDALDFLVRRARNGTSIIYSKAIVTDYEGAQGYSGHSRMLTQLQIDAWKPVVEEIYKQDAIATIQMFQCDRMSWPEVNPANRSIEPSHISSKQDNPMTVFPYPVTEAMSRFDIDHVFIK